MVSVKSLIGTAAAVMVSTTAFAADMPQPMPQLQYQPVVIQQPPTAWYLRGYIGVGINNQADFIFQPNPANNPVNVLTTHSSLGDSVFFGGGVGYEFNNWFRVDVTAEYRARTPFNAFLIYQSGGVFGDQYNASIRSDIFLANAYVDLGTWNCLTPFVGFGVGGALNTFDNLTDIGIATSGSGVGTNASQWNFAWAVHAGIDYSVTQNFSVELAYRYLNYGSVTDQIHCFGGCNPDTYKVQNLSSNDFMLGFRYRFPIKSAPIIVTPQPVALQPAPVYAPPPPVYAPPPQYPLSTRG